MSLQRRLSPYVASGLLALCATLSAQAAPLQPFAAGDLTEIESGYAGQPFLLLLWSVDCAPCHAELKLLGELRRERGDLPVALLSADPPALREEAMEVLEDYGMADLTSWQFGEDIPERLRHAVDPGWYGELPRSYFYNATHARSAHSGRVQRPQLENWLDALAE